MVNKQVPTCNSFEPRKFPLFPTVCSNRAVVSYIQARTTARDSSVTHGRGILGGNLKTCFFNSNFSGNKEPYFGRSVKKYL